MKRIISALIGLLSLSPQVNADLLSKEQFTSKFLVVLTKALPSHAITMNEPLSLKIVNPKKEQATAFLDNAFTEYLREPVALNDIILRYATALAEVHGSAVEVKINAQRIVPVIKDRAWLRDMQLAEAKSGKSVTGDRVFESLNDQLVIVYAEDTPTTTQYFSTASLQDLGILKTDLRKLAITNLREILPDIELHQGEHVSMLVAGGDYVVSLLLFDELWQPGRFDVDGDVVVAIPTRDLLLFTGANNVAGIAKLREMAQRAATEGPYSLTDQLFIHRSGQFELFK